MSPIPTTSRPKHCPAGSPEARLSRIRFLVAAILPLGLAPPTSLLAQAAPPAPDQGLLQTLAVQIELEASGFSPGLLDGSPGPRTTVALRHFQRASGLVPTGALDDLTLKALAPRLNEAIGLHVVTVEDERQVSFCPVDWIERSRRERLLYPSLSNYLAERYHTSERFLAALNPQLDLASLPAGTRVRVPLPRERAPQPPPERLEIDLEQKLVYLMDARDGVAGLVHCSIARDPSTVERGETTVANIVVEPGYTFDPAKWPEVKGIEKKLSIPPGPRSPVGLRWIGLGRAGVGLHGSPEPENIGKTGSHGCFRLTNWDAIELASRLRVGTKVRIVDTSPASGLLGRPAPPTPPAGPTPGQPSPPAAREPGRYILPPALRPQPARDGVTR